MNKLLPIGVIILVAVIVFGLLFIKSDLNSKANDINGNQLPNSLAQWYPPMKPGPEYLSKMFILGNSMIGIIANTLQGDAMNASKSFELFSKNYKQSSELVPEWGKYYDMKALDKLGEAVKSGNPDSIMQAIPEIGNTCTNCHKDQKPYVWAEFYMKDFRKIQINTPEGPMPFPAGKMKYLVVGFDGTMVNAAEGQKESTNASFELFKMMFNNMKDACYQCHTENPKYFVSTDVENKINDTESQIATGSFGTVITNMQQIGQGCYKCHVIHESIQRIREQMDENN